MKQAGIDPFRAIADPHRRQMLSLLTTESMTINELAGNFEMSRPAVSKHLKILYSAGFINIETIGRERYCILNREGFNELQSWINHFDGFWKEKLGNLKTLLDKKGKA